ncbi:nuclear transport factor 2 family protein [Carbonactinospora thermoautotrophica]|nr:nuclear transport factor 2 family protein [Carbonactinospora thermoautotrophica]
MSDVGMSDGEMTDPRQVEAVNTAFYQAVERGDLDTLGSIWVDAPYADSALCVHPGWLPLRGRDEILRSWALIMANSPYIQFFLTDLTVEVTGELAVVTCNENILTAVGHEADATGLAGGRAVTTNIFRRTPDGWRLWIHHASPVLGPEE